MMDAKVCLENIKAKIVLSPVVQSITVVTERTLNNRGYFRARMRLVNDDFLEVSEEIFDYFMESESDRIQEAMDEFNGEYDDEELRLMRIKFISQVAN